MSVNLFTLQRRGGGPVGGIRCLLVFPFALVGEVVVGSFSTKITLRLSPLIKQSSEQV